MKAHPKGLGAAILGFVVLVMLPNLPGTRAWLVGLLGDNEAFRFVAASYAIVFFALAAWIWLAAIRHLRTNAGLQGPARVSWTAITYGAFVFGAVAYYFRFIRGESAAGKGPR